MQFAYPLHIISQISLESTSDSKEQEMYKNLRSINTQMMTKSQQMRIRKNINLPYIELLSQIIQDGKMKAKNSKNGSQSLNNELLLYSAHHDCSNLWKLLSIIENKNIDKAVQSNSIQLFRTWPSITKFGLKQLFEPQSQKQEQIVFQNILKYLQQSQQILAQKTSENIDSDFTKGTLSNILFLTYGLPTVYPAMFSTFQFRQSFKQSYILTLNKLVSQYQEQMKNKSFRRFFPVQLFNISDQPILKDLYFKYYLSYNPQSNLKQHHANLAFFARFGLPCFPYIRSFFKTVNHIIKQRSTTNHAQVLQEDIIISSCMFIIFRKILCLDTGTTQEINWEKKSILSDLKQIFNQLSITKFINQKNQDFSITCQERMSQTINFLSHVKTTYNQKVISYEKRVSSMLAELFQTFSIKDFQQQKQLRSIDVQTDVKIVRYILLFLHLLLEDSSSPSVHIQLECIKKVLNAKQIEMILRNIILVGDHLAEFVFAQQKYKFLVKKNLFEQSESSFYRDVMQMRKLFCQQIDKIKISQTTDLHLLQNRLQNDDFLLTQESRLPFHPLSSLNQKSNSINQKMSKQIIKCLLSDRQFMSSFVIKSYEQLGQKLFKLNPKIVSIREKSSKYPFLPNFSIQNLNEQCLQLYLRSEICQHTRIQYSKPHLVHDIRSLSQFQKLICQISSVNWK